MRQVFIASFALAVCATPALCQQGSDNPPAGQTTAAAPPAQPHEGWLNATSTWIKGAFDSTKAEDGFYADLHGLPPGSGIHAGPGYRHQLFDGRATVNGSIAAAWSRSTVAQGTFELPRLAGGRVTIGAQAKRQDFSRVDFFGIGPDTREADGSQFRLQNADYVGYGRVKPRTWLIVGGRVGYSDRITIERPRFASSPPVQDLFTPATAPGLVDHPAFLHGDVSVDVDTRNHPARPTSGGDYRVSIASFNDRNFDRYSFRQVEAEASQFIPILHENWVIALRARVARTDTSNGNVAPFYLLPSLGGSASLRGYEDTRFRDRNLLSLNAEYRWRVFGALDGALFYDTGKVARRFGDLDLTDLKNSYGIGFRFHSSDATLFRLDVGHGKEGTRVLVSLTEALRAGHGSVLIPYVP